MQSLHTHSILPIPCELPVLSRKAIQPYGIMFGECKIGASIPFDKDIPFHLLFLLKGAVCVKANGKEIDIFQNEFLLVDNSTSAVEKEYECVCTHRTHYVTICLEKPLTNGTQWLEAQPHATPIPSGLSALLRYMLPNMPLNEKINHHLIPRITSTIMRRCKHTTIT